MNVTKTFLPPLSDYVAYLEGIWDSTWLTNAGPRVQELESKLKDFLGVRHFFLVNNGTIAIQIGIRALELTGEVITTPFSYVATTSSLVWERCRPVFVDIDPRTLCLDPEKVEAAITPRTTGILPVHVYGNSCDVERIQDIAERHNLKVLYDAAHAFGVDYKPGTSVLKYGHLSTLSFHATKLFHTGEGGAIITDDDEVAHKISYLRNFGHNGPEAFWGLGVNGKVSELHAAMGLSVLPHLSSIIESRRAASDLYDRLLAPCSEISRPELQMGIKYNYAYYPVLFSSESLLLGAVAALKEEGINPRRYFYPALNSLPYVEQVSMPVTDDVSKRVLCLPLFHDISASDVRRISTIILKAVSDNVVQVANF